MGAIKTSGWNGTNDAHNGTERSTQKEPNIDQNGLQHRVEMLAPNPLPSSITSIDPSNTQRRMIYSTLPLPTSTGVNPGDLPGPAVPSDLSTQESAGMDMNAIRIGYPIFAVAILGLVIWNLWLSRLTRRLQKLLEKHRRHSRQRHRVSSWGGHPRRDSRSTDSRHHLSSSSEDIAAPPRPSHRGGGHIRRKPLPLSTTTPPAESSTKQGGAAAGQS
ncbi:hypothetical protein F5Y05DRAFT_346063 [Hypoxylon sp. FL0543]|nr:hypothetical protein F5Y05DRAFT_346063 [Hypoxylon sp. FL0543]